MWRSPTRKRHRSEVGSSTHSGNSGRGDNDGPMDADGFDNDQSMEVMKWHDEVVEDGKEARTISGEGEIPSLATGWLQ